MKASLLPIKQKYKSVKRFEVEQKKGQSGHYKVWMIASKLSVDEDYTTALEIDHKEISYGKNMMTKFKKHSQHMRDVARSMNIEIPKSPKKIETQEAMKGFIRRIVNEGDSKTGTYMTQGNVRWSKLGDGIVIRKMDGEFISFFDYSKGGVANQWNNI